MWFFNIMQCHEVIKCSLQRKLDIYGIINLTYYTNMESCRVQWCDLLHCGNVILSKAGITPETLIYPEGF